MKKSLANLGVKQFTADVKKKFAKTTAPFVAKQGWQGYLKNPRHLALSGMAIIGVTAGAMGLKSLMKK